MNPRHLRIGALIVLCVAVVGASSVTFSAATLSGADAQTVKGLEITTTGVTRAKRVSLQDCPPGENSVRGVIRPNEENEFLTVAIDVKVSPSFTPADIDKPLLHDDAGNEYKTAQSFRDVNEESSYSCQFSFRVPSGTKPARLTIEDATFDIGTLAP